MASNIIGLGRAMHNGMINGMNLSNQIADYQNQNLVDQYKYPAYMAEANAARTGAEVNTMANLGTQIDWRGLMDMPEEGRANAQINAGATESQALLNIGQAPNADVMGAILAQSPYANGTPGMTDSNGMPVGLGSPGTLPLLDMYKQMYANSGDAGQALQSSIGFAIPSYLR